MADRRRPLAYSVLRASTRRVLAMVEAEIARQGGGRVVIHNDQFEHCGSRRVYLPANCRAIRPCPQC